MLFKDLSNAYVNYGDCGNDFYYSYSFAAINQENLEDILKTFKAKNYLKLNKLAKASGLVYELIEEGKELIIEINSKNKERLNIYPNFCTSLSVEPLQNDILSNATAFFISIKEIRKSLIKLQLKPEFLAAHANEIIDPKKFFYINISYDEMAYSAGLAGCESEGLEINKIFYGGFDEVKDFLCKNFDENDFKEAKNFSELNYNCGITEENLSAICDRFGVFKATAQDPYKSRTSEWAAIISDNEIWHTIGSIDIAPPRYENLRENFLEFGEIKRLLKTN